MSSKASSSSKSYDIDWNLTGLFGDGDRYSDPYISTRIPSSSRSSRFATLSLHSTVSSSSLTNEVEDAQTPPASFRTLIDAARKLIKAYQYTRPDFNPDRDRHRYTIPFKHNQIKLNDGTRTNGSWITFSDHSPDVFIKRDEPAKYIAISAPTDKYIPIFMRLLFEQKIPVIVSLTAFKENGHEKATPYLPYELNKTISKKRAYEVTCIKEIKPVKLAKGWKLQERDFALKMYGSDDVHRFRQFHLPNWKDFTAGCPDGIFALDKQVHNYCQRHQITGPILAHCSGGVGRAGVFLLTFEVWERVLAGRVPDIFNLALQARIQRGNLGGHRDQFRMVYKVYDKMLSEGLRPEQSTVKISVCQKLDEGDFLTIRGSKEPLNWKSGIPLRRVGEDRWEIDIRNIPGCEYKLLLNDEKWEAGSNHRMNGKPRTFSSLRFS